jgi:hypothetical protein
MRLAILQASFIFFYMKCASHLKKIGNYLQLMEYFTIFAADYCITIKELL